MRVGNNWRLLICGDLSIRHHYSRHGRDGNLERIRQSSFGVGRRFAQNAGGLTDYLIVARTFLGDMVIDSIAIAHQPSRENLMTLLVRIRGFLAGFTSVRKEKRNSTAAFSTRGSLKQPNSVSRVP
jgi:hypothetical protein